MTRMEEFEARVDAEYFAKNLTDKWRAILKITFSFRGHDGFCAPSQETICARVNRTVRCCLKTVVRALAQGCKLGLLFWRPRHRREGWRKLRTSNLYIFSVPAGPVKSGCGPVWRRYPTDGQSAPLQAKEASKEAALQVKLRESRGDPAMTALILAQMEANRRAGRVEPPRLCGKYPRN